MKNIFTGPSSRLPKSDPKILRVDMETSDIGARRKQLAKAGSRKSNLSVQHVGGKGR